MRFVCLGLYVMLRKIHDTELFLITYIMKLNELIMQKNKQQQQMQRNWRLRLTNILHVDYV